MNNNDSSFFKRKKFMSKLRDGVKTKEVQHIVINDRVYKLDMKDIDRRIKISKLTKKRKQLYLYREGLTSKQIAEKWSIRTKYFIINSNGDCIGWATISINDPHSLIIEYWLQEEQRGKGIGTVMLEEVIRQIYEIRDFDNLEFPSETNTNTDRTQIKNIYLEISSDNIASKKIAMKNGLKENEDGLYSLTIDEFKVRNPKHQGRERVE